MASKFRQNSLCIIIPMFNEKNTASSCIDAVIKEIDKLKSFTKLLVIDDGSIDKTPQILENKKKLYKNKLILITHEKNLGYGVAMQTGISFALRKGFEFYLTMDSDLTNNPLYIHDFVKAMSNDIDCVKASRYIKGGKVVNVSYFRELVSIIGNYVASLFFRVGIRDCTNGFKMVRLKLLKGVKLKENSFSIILEEMYYLKKGRARFMEIPNILYPRKNSKSHFKYNPKTYYDYFKYVVKASLFLALFLVNSLANQWFVL